MTDNEKRAHDLAIALLNVAMKPENMGYFVTNQDGDNQIKPYEVYKNLYNSCLTAFNRDFPDGNR